LEICNTEKYSLFSEGLSSSGEHYSVVLLEQNCMTDLTVMNCLHEFTVNYVE